MSGLGRLLGGFGGFFCNPPQSNGGRRQYGSEQSYQAAKYNVPVPPVGSRFIISIIGLLLLLAFNILGYRYIDNGRRNIGISLIVAGDVIGFAGLLLFYLTGFIWSWNWIV